MNSQSQNDRYAEREDTKDTIMAWAFMIGWYGLSYALYAFLASR